MNSATIFTLEGCKWWQKNVRCGISVEVNGLQ